MISLPWQIKQFLTNFVPDKNEHDIGFALSNQRNGVLDTPGVHYIIMYVFI